MIPVLEEEDQMGIFDRLVVQLEKQLDCERDCWMIGSVSVLGRDENLCSTRTKSC